MQVENSRRLTGPNLYAASPGAIAEVTWRAGQGDPAVAIAIWREQARRMLEAIGWSGSELYARPYRGGAALFLTAPIDLLMPATEVNEWAIASAVNVLAGQAPAPLEPALQALLAAIEAARWPGLAQLAGAARARRALFLLDDAGCTLGVGPSARSFARGDTLPAPSELAWSTLRTMPIGLITGTNGKTTCSRLVTRMARLAGRRPGNTSSDGVLVDEQLVERGDCSGPAGARTVLRHPDVDIAVLETARGSILRRGLAVERCDAALITNVTVDHLGDYGIDDLATMARVKALVARGADTVILNAADPALVELAPTLAGELVYFALDPAAPVISAHRATGGEAWFVRDGQLVRARGTVEHALVAEAEVPITFGGLARYNTENALGSAALARALGLPETAIVAGLRSFTSSQRDNPGRGNQLDLGGVQVLLDFGHNPAAVRAVLVLARAMVGSGRLFVAIGMAGDRPDDELAAVAEEIAATRPDAVYLRDLPEYLRGRDPGEVPRILRNGLVAAGLPSAAIIDAADELASIRQALAAARPGDLVLGLIHLDQGVDTWLADQGAR
ncbi:MAG TPA: Mur ligase family protein [Kofleriaceae bacterium]|nr:Mur ligase family protein [Kofleriaceae bacterium]